MGNLPRKLEILSARLPTFQFLASSLWSEVFKSVKTSCNVALFCTGQSMDMDWQMSSNLCLWGKEL